MFDEKSTVILELIRQKQPLSSSEIHEGLEIEMGYSTVRKYLRDLALKQLIQSQGIGKALRYSISPSYELFVPIDIDAYYELLMEERNAKPVFNLALIPEILPNVELFTPEELKRLNGLHAKYTANVKPLSDNEYKNELETLAIDLSWKSAEIEGNTYSLLETEALLKQQEIAEGKSREDAQALLNHKSALDFIIAEPDFLTPLSLPGIEDIHSLLIKDLGVDRNVRKRGVSVGGTLYKPLSIESQIKEAIKHMCTLVNSRKNVFEKALLVLVLLSYIQAFNDGNKRTARIISNAILMCENYCPLSYRSVKASDYKKTMLLFYEQNNITAFKKLFMDQYEFAVDTYFNL